MIRATARCLPAFVPLALGACSTAGGYPSLAPRDFERTCGTARPAPEEARPETPALPPASAELVGRLEGLVSAAEEADRQFREQLGSATGAVARAAGTAQTGDAWASAQVALGKLETSRSAAVAALAELDTLYADARDAEPAGPSPRTGAIANTREQVSGLVARQDSMIASLSARLKN